MSVNYIKHHINVFAKITEDVRIAPRHISVYNALFLIWNNAGFADLLSINRNDIMRMGKIGNLNTYTNTLKELHEYGYINYKPSNNPLIGSLVTIIRFDNSTDKGSDKTTVKGSGKATDNSTDKGSDTLYKQLNIQTIETNKQELFEKFWDMYGKKEDKARTLKKFKTLDISVCNKIMDCLPSYIKKTPDVKYRKNPLTWLNGECWNDEISEPQKQDDSKPFDYRAQVSKYDGKTKYQPINRYENNAGEKSHYIQHCKIHSFKMEEFWHDGTKLEQTW